MQVTEVYELTSEERKLYHFLLTMRIQEEKAVDTIIVPVKKIEESLMVQELNRNERHERICDSLLNIMCVPALVKGKNISVIKEWTLGDTGASIEFSDEFINNFEEACDYLFDYVCNLDKKTFLITPLER